MYLDCLSISIALRADKACFAWSNSRRSAARITHSDRGGRGTSVQTGELIWLFGGVVNIGSVEGRKSLNMRVHSSKNGPGWRKRFANRGLIVDPRQLQPGRQAGKRRSTSRGFAFFGTAAAALRFGFVVGLVRIQTPGDRRPRLP